MLTVRRLPIRLRVSSVSPAMMYFSLRAVMSMGRRSSARRRRKESSRLNMWTVSSLVSRISGSVWIFPTMTLSVRRSRVIRRSYRRSFGGFMPREIFIRALIRGFTVRLVRAIGRSISWMRTAAARIAIVRLRRSLRKRISSRCQNMRIRCCSISKTIRISSSRRPAAMR